jgi:hypothetical protein
MGPLIDPATAERILDGEAVGPPRLVRLLGMAAGGDQHGAEARSLPGEENAVRAFRSVHDVGARPYRRHRVPLNRHPWARPVTIKVAALSLVVTAGGVALAASVGAIPGIAPFHSDDAQRISTHHPIHPGGQAPTAAAPASATARDMPGLCRALRTESLRDAAAASHNPRFAALVAAAGGIDNVDSFCVAALGEDGAGRSTNHPTPPHPTEEPP